MTSSSQKPVTGLRRIYPLVLGLAVAGLSLLLPLTPNALAQGACGAP
jgi:hypothetical protein